LIGLAQE